MRILLMALAGMSLALTLTGCVGSSRPQNSSTNTPTVTFTSPPPQFVDAERMNAKLDKVQSDIKNEIQTSTNSNQTHMNGLLDVNISKLGERVTGMENNIKEAIGIKNELHSTATAELKAEVHTVVETTARVDNNMKAVMTNTANLELEVKNVFKMTNEMSAKLDNVNTQIGIGNSIKNIEEKITQTAGRDLNMVSKETVELVLGIFTGFFLMVVVALVLLGKGAREREALRTKEAESNVEKWQGVALQAIARLDPEKAREITLPKPS